MKLLVVYYSRTGVTEKVAQEIARGLNCPLEKISDLKSRTGLVGYLLSGREAMLEKCPPIKPIEYNPENFDLVIIGTPNWAGNISSPIRAYLKQTEGKIKNFALVITQGGKGAQRAQNKAEALIGQPAKASLVLSTKEVVAGSDQEKINLFLKQINSLNKS